MTRTNRKRSKLPYTENKNISTLNGTILGKTKPLLKKKRVDQDVEARRKVAMRYFKMMPCEYPDDTVESAFDEVGYPYGLQTIMSKIISNQKDENLVLPGISISKKIPRPLLPQRVSSYGPKGKKDLIGLKIKKKFSGEVFIGTVIR